MKTLWDIDKFDVAEISDNTPGYEDYQEDCGKIAVQYEGLFEKYVGSVSDLDAALDVASEFIAEKCGFEVTLTPREDSSWGTFWDAEKAK